VMKVVLEGIIVTFTTTINALTAQVAMLVTQVNNIANNNTIDNNRNNHSREEDRLWYHVVETTNY